MGLRTGTSGWRGTAWAGGVRAAVCALVGGATGPVAREAAQRALRHGWPVLLPTPAERARLLSSLLPQGSEAADVSPGKRFMRELLVGALLAGGGLRSALRRHLRSTLSSTANQAL